MVNAEGKINFDEIFASLFVINVSILMYKKASRNIIQYNTIRYNKVTMTAYVWFNLTRIRRYLLCILHIDQGNSIFVSSRPSEQQIAEAFNFTELLNYLKLFS